MMHTKTRSALFSAALFVGIASLGFPRSAEASPTFPPVLQQALETQLGGTFCVPLCTACHETMLGGLGTLNSFGKSMKAKGLVLEQPNTLAPALKKIGDDMVDSDGDGTSDIDELKKGDSPSIAGPDGVGQFCTDLRYGCGARIAAAPPATDRLGLFSAGLVVLGLVLARRRGSARRAS